MRGKQLSATCITLLIRITPAHAGKTVLSIARALAIADHPRACGENTSPRLSSFICRGSPPRMRGKRFNADRIGMLNRITPAHAGKTR